MGQGGFGVVYKAKNRLTQKRVAIKAVHKSKITDMTGFIREYQILSKLDHPNILNIREIWEWEKMLFIVTDYCQGGDLFAYMLERNQLAEHEEEGVRNVVSECLGRLAIVSAATVTPQIAELLGHGSAAMRATMRGTSGRRRDARGANV